MDEKKKPPPLSDSELQAWREEQISRDRRGWLWRSIKTGIVWTGAGIAGTLSGIDGLNRILEWWRK